MTRLDLFAPALGHAGLTPDRVVYVEAGDEDLVDRLNLARRLNGTKFDRDSLPIQPHGGITHHCGWERERPALRPLS
jgi:hypothetical protein